METVATKARNLIGFPTILLQPSLPSCTVGGIFSGRLAFRSTSNFFPRLSSTSNLSISHHEQRKSSLNSSLEDAERWINSGSYRDDVIPDKWLSGNTSSSCFEVHYMPEVDAVPPWGHASICGRRQKMEDAVATVPRFFKVPVIGDHHQDGRNKPLSHLAAAHFFGVYDGHEGSQVANYCRDHVHVALAEELEVIMANMSDTSIKDICEEEWRRAFTKCFLKVDDEVAGLTLETVGSTAVVAVVLPSYFVVANCGDSRAVLCRYIDPMPVSMDHKPTREDEYARIKAAGGEVIKWNTGYSVNGVLAKRQGERLTATLSLSRAIGDRYWKPWVIPEPEVMFIPRTNKIRDGILVLASDGLWDVMTNQEVSEIALERIYSWHRRRLQQMPGAKVAQYIPRIERCDGIDPAATAAAEYLSKLALEKGSKDNISVLVVDLEAIP